MRKEYLWRKEWGEERIPVEEGARKKYLWRMGLDEEGIPVEEGEG